ncbi:uncharacterized protein LOC129582643 [Paramacrobiotus metropolitanus]|uniref:uncharacterized protein LOC129582643 n=1 Tax=Paramacrobiotus metropolitanus TaxID=2943436 RepID=UPI002445A004|nr:uncharacterized protein LOC129582643 [Paramacrobiotus metropolitanus]
MWSWTIWGVRGTGGDQCGAPAHFRAPYPLEKNPAFEKCWVMLPRDEDLRVVTYRKEFWPLWNRKSGTLGGWFDDEDEHQWLVYYMPAQYEPMETSDCELHLRRIKEWIDASDRELRHRMFLSTTSPSKNARSQSPEVKLEMSTELSITGIPSDILIYIFNDYLTAEDNLRSRRACKLWNDTLSSQPASSRVIDCIDGGEIKLAKLMLKMVSSATHILFVTGNATPAPLRTLPTMLVAMNLKISVIFLKNFVVADEDILRWSASRGVRLNEAFRRVCDKVMLKDAGGLRASLKYFDCKGLKMDGSLVSGVVGVSWETDENFVQCGDPV